jgi:hypothetical protein
MYLMFNLIKGISMKEIILNESNKMVVILSQMYYRDIAKRSIVSLKNSLKQP